MRHPYTMQGKESTRNEAKIEHPMHAIFDYVHAYIRVPRSPKQVYPLLFFKSAVRTPIQSRPKLSHTRSLLLSKPAGLAESLGHTFITMPCMTSSVVGHMHMRTVHCTRRRVRTCVRQPFCLRALHCMLRPCLVTPSKSFRS